MQISAVTRHVHTRETHKFTARDRLFTKTHPGLLLAIYVFEPSPMQHSHMRMHIYMLLPILVGSAIYIPAQQPMSPQAEDAHALSSCRVLFISLVLGATTNVTSGGSAAVTSHANTNTRPYSASDLRAVTEAHATTHKAAATPATCGFYSAALCMLFCLVPLAPLLLPVHIFMLANTRLQLHACPNTNICGNAHTHVTATTRVLSFPHRPCCYYQHPFPFR